MARDPELDITFDLYAVREYEAYPITEIEVDGYSLSRSFEAVVIEDIVVAGIGLAGYAAESEDDIAMYMGVSGDGIANENRTNWVAWSQIGNASFLVTRTNDAGYYPMTWNGYVYQILKLGQQAIVYGSGGITQMMPVTKPMPTFGFKDLTSSGILCRTSVAGNEHIHYFISKYNILWKLTSQGLVKLGYKLFLSNLTNPVLLYDEHRERLYISDETYGFVYNDNALGGWHSDVTGILEVSDELYLASPTTLVNNSLDITTNVIDFSFRGRKAIEGVELGMECASGSNISVAIDYRYDKSDSFSSLGWRPVSPEGYVSTKVSAVDLRVTIKNDAFASFQLHYLNFHIKYDDRRYRRGARVVKGEQPI